MLTTYRRHIKTCAHRSEGRKYRRCRCPIWADGFIGREEIRKTLNTRNWEKAQEMIRDMGGRRQTGRRAGARHDRRGLGRISLRCQGKELAEADHLQV